MAGKYSPPKTLRQAIAPLTIVNWMFATIVFEYPPGHLRPILSLIYAIGIITFYGSMVCASTGDLLSFHPTNATDLGVAVYQSLSFGLMCVALSTMIFGWLRRQELKDCIDRMAAVDDSMLNLAIPTNYSKTFKHHLYALVGIGAVMISSIILNSMLIFKSVHQGGFSFPLVVTFHQPLTVLLVCNSTFVGLVWYVGQRFQSLNDHLTANATPNLRLGKVQETFQKSLRRVSPIAEQAIDDSYESRVKLSFVKRSRKIHQELCRIARQLNKAYAIQLLLFMGISCSMMIGLLYTTYVSTSGILSQSAISEAISMICLAATFLVEILMVSHSCAKASFQAQRTGDIIHELLEPTADEELRKEIEAFSLQLLLSPLSFTGYGFFTLDYTFVRGVIGTIASYLVILIQMSNVPVHTSSSLNVNIKDNETTF